MKKTAVIATTVLTGAVLFYACKKEYDHPPLKTVNEGAKITVSQLKARVAPASSSYHFGAGDTSLYGTILADESSGNIYKQSFLLDEAGGAIQLNLLNTGGLAVGDKIRINLNKLWLVNANNMIYIDSVDVGKSVVKQSSGNVVTPKVVTISEVLAGTVPTNSNSLQSQLVRIESVEFLEKGLPFADAIGKQSMNRTLKVCGGTTSLTVRSSGYANFANKAIPSGSGYMIAIVTQYNSTMQMTIRDYQEIQMTGVGCPTPPPPPGSYLFKDFNDNSLTNGGWTNVNASGSINWTVTTNTTVATPYAQCNNYLGTGNQPACESWLISPPVDLSAAITPIYTFSSAALFTGPAPQTLISTNYVSGAPNTGTWTALTATFGTSSTFVSSGNINLSAYKTTNVRVAIKYTGNANSGLRFQVDNIRIGE